MSKEANSSVTNAATLLDYLRLFRIPNVFTALADVMMGYVFVQHQLLPVAPLLWLIVASALLYTAGMVLNDVFDVEVDARERPARPIPSGRISLGRARWIGLGMLAAGVTCGWTAGGFPIDEHSPWWRSGLIATVLAGLVVAYDAWLKKTAFGPVAMGACRFLNVLLGMSLGAAVAGPAWAMGFATDQLLVAGGIGVYIMGVTWFARSEAVESDRSSLVGATFVMVAGIALLLTFPRFGPPGFPYTLDPTTIWLVLLLLIMIPVVRRCGTAMLDPTPQNVQAAVKHAILSLIFLDASVALMVSDPFPAIIILLLLLPALLLGRWVYST